MELARKTRFVTSSHGGLDWTLGSCSGVWLTLLLVFTGGFGFGFGFGFVLHFITHFGFGFDFMFGFGFDFVSSVRFDFNFDRLLIFVLCFSCCCFALDSILRGLQRDRVTRAFDRSLKSIQCFSTTRGLVGFSRLYSAVFRCTRMQQFAHICILHPSSRRLRQLRVLHLSAEEVGGEQDCTGSLAGCCSFEALSSSSNCCLISSLHCKHRPMPRDKNQ